MYERGANMTISIDNHIFSGVEASNDEGVSSGPTELPTASPNVSSLPEPLAASSAGSLSFLLNGENVEATQLSGSETFDMAEIQAS